MPSIDVCVEVLCLEVQSGLFARKYTVSSSSVSVIWLSYASLQPILEVHSAPGNRVIFTGDV